MKNMFPGWLVWTALALTGCGGGGGSAGPDAKVTPTPLAVLATSYENKNLRVAALDVSQIPVMAADAALWTQVPESLAFGDFFQEGKYSAFVAANQANGAAKAYFLKKNDAGTWTDATADLLTDRTVCTHVVQAISADFNGDGKPDIYVACGGTAAMQQVFFMSRTGSGQTGYVRQETGFGLQSWGAAAGDIDGDGDIDLVVTDNGGTVALMNDGSKLGASSFSKDMSRIPTTASNGWDFPTQHRKVFLIPNTNPEANPSLLPLSPDLVIAGTGDGSNSTAIYLKNNNNNAKGNRGRFLVNPLTGVSAMFENKLTSPTNSVKFYDVVAYNDALYVLSKNVGVESGQPVTDLLILKYEAPSTITSGDALLNLSTANTGVLFSAHVNSPTIDGFISQFKINTAGRLVAFDGACPSNFQRCGFDIAP